MATRKRGATKSTSTKKTTASKPSGKSVSAKKTTTKKPTPSAPALEKYIMRGPGATEGKLSGQVHQHQEELYMERGRMRRRYTCEVPPGEFDHLFDEDGKSVHVKKKL